MEGLQLNCSILSFIETWLCDYNNTIHNFIGYSYIHTLRCKNKVGSGVSMYNIIIITLYRPPNIQIKVFTDKLPDPLQFLSKENKYMFIVGCFNVDTYSAIINHSMAVNNFINTFLSYCHTPLIDKYTREDKERGTSTLLYIIYTNVTQISNLIQSGIFKTNISDHYSIFGIIDLMMNTHKTEYVTKHEYSEKII